MKIIAIDIAYKKPIAYCVLGERGKLITLASVEPQNDIYHTSTAVLDSIRPYGKSLVVAEKILLIHNMNTAFLMAGMGAMLEKGVRDYGGIFFQFHPLTWQKAMLKPEKGDDRKQLSIDMAQAWLRSIGCTDMTTLSDDQADAMNICLYAYANKKRILEAISGGKKFSEK